jgi:hypothetical protein
MPGFRVVLLPLLSFGLALAFVFEKGGFAS